VVALRHRLPPGLAVVAVEWARSVESLNRTDSAPTHCSSVEGASRELRYQAASEAERQKGRAAGGDCVDSQRGPRAFTIQVSGSLAGELV
jgi:hypothetical protein